MIKRLLTYAFALIVCVLSAEIRKSNIAAFSTMKIQNDKNEYTASDYIQDGLIAMWDGIENSGWGAHDSNSQWVDLCGNMHLDVSTEYDNVVFGSNCAIFDGTTAYKIMESRQIYEIYTNSITIEILFESGVKDFGGCFCSFEAYPRVWWIYNRQWNVASSANIRNIPLNQIIKGTMQDTEMWYNGEKYGSYNKAYYASSTGYVYLGYCTYVGNFTGKIYALRIYNRKLSDEEVIYNHNIDKERFNLP